MQRRSDFIARALLTLLFSYLLSIGATFNGLLSPEFHSLTLGVMIMVALGWLIAHGRRPWHRTALDVPLLLWAGVFGLSLVANNDALRRSAIALWYIGVYAGVWYITADLFANRIVRRDTVVDALLIVGVVVLFFGYLQLVPSLTRGLVLPRPVSVFGNPNYLGAFLTVLIPLLIARLCVARFGKFMLGIYLLLSVLMLILSVSRGAWLGVMVGVGTIIALWLADRGLLSRKGLVTWWNRLSGRIRWFFAGMAVVIIIGVIAVGFVLLRSLSAPGRSAGLRTEIWGAAVEMFAQKPLFGHGLFTFGRELVRLPGVTPDSPHSHAHNLILQVAAELGVAGLLVMIVSAIGIVKAVRQHWYAVIGRDRMLLAGALGSATAFGIHHLTDLPAMMPAIALCGLIPLALSVISPESIPMKARWRQVGHPYGMLLLWGFLLLTGWWSSSVYGNYVRALDYAGRTLDYRGSAQQLDAVIEADPLLSLYSLEQGFLWGMAAANGESEARAKALAAYERFIEQEPGYAVAWANRAELLAASGDFTSALQSMSKATQLDPEIWQYSLNEARYAANLGDQVRVDRSLDMVLQVYADASLHPDLDNLAARRLVTSAPLKWSVPAQIALLLNENRGEDAFSLLSQLPLPDSASGRVMTALVTLSRGDYSSAEGMIKTVDSLAVLPVEVAWAFVGKAWLARAMGDLSGIAQAESVVSDMLKRGPLDRDDEMLVNIAYSQFLRLTIERQYLPGVLFPVDDPVLLYLLETAANAPAN